MLVDGGYAIFILPSLYKLDLFDFDFIEQRRKSSHISKMTIYEWQSVIESGNLFLQKAHSKPIGVLSGLSYLLWLDEAFLPSRDLTFGKEVHNNNSLKHRKLKDIFSKHDKETDKLFNSKNINQSFIYDLIRNPNVLKSILMDNFTDELENAINEFISLLCNINITENKLQRLNDKLSKIDYYALANSSMLIYKNGK